MPLSPLYRPATHHRSLGDGFFDLVAAADFPQTVLRFRNDRHAARIGLDQLTDAEWLHHFGRFSPLPDTLQTPLALRYVNVNALFEEGELLVTSGLDKIFPKGLPVARVTNVKRESVASSVGATVRVSML